MRKKALFLAAIVLLLLVPTATAWAEDPAPEFTYNVETASHKVRNKWDLSGTFVAHPSYTWGGLAPGATWNYSIHIKEAMNGDYSVGSIHFWTGEIDVVGHVKATERYYDYWGSSVDSLAAVGTADYSDTTYYFMFLYADRALWFALSTTPYDSYWAAESIWPTAQRAYQLHSLVAAGAFPLDYKVIHE